MQILSARFLKKLLIAVHTDRFIMSETAIAPCINAYKHIGYVITIISAAVCCCTFLTLRFAPDDNVSAKHEVRIADDDRLIIAAWYLSYRHYRHAYIFLSVAESRATGAQSQQVSRTCIERKYLTFAHIIITNSRRARFAVNARST